MIGDRVALVLGQGLLEATHDLAGPAQRESNTVSENVAPGLRRPISEIGVAGSCVPVVLCSSNVPLFKFMGAFVL